MEMMDCPHCGAKNSTKRQTCYQCEGDLRGAPAQQRKKTEYVPTCARCSLAAIYAPAGVKLAPTEVYCTKKKKVVSAEMVAGECFTEAFGWKREEILD